MAPSVWDETKGRGMQDLTLVGVHDDGEHLVLSAADGTRYRVTIDEPLRAAVRRDRARLGQLQLAMDGRMSPREIQARIRAGQSAEAVAEASGLPVEQVRRFEGPVLAEREHVVDLARAVPLRRSAPAAAQPPRLDAVVAERLEQREVDPDTALWDAWRAEDGTWTIRVTFSAAGREREAHWTFLPQTRQLSPADDEARWLVDADPEEAAARRLTAVRGPVYDVVAQGTLRPASVVEDDPVEAASPASSAEPASATVDLLDTLRERRGRRMRAVTAEEDDVPDAVQTALDTLRAEESRDAAAPTEDDESTVPTPTPTPAPAAAPAGHGPRPGPRRGNGRRPVPDPIRGTHPAGRRLSTDAGERVVVLPDTDEASRSERPATPTSRTDVPRPTRAASPRAEGSAAGRGREQVPSGRSTAAGREPTPSPAPPSPAEPSPEQAAARKARRASVPSWDDIIFGARRE